MVGDGCVGSGPGVDDGDDLFRRLIAYSSDLISIADSDGRITFVSPSHERILGYDRADLVGEAVHERVHREDRERVETAFERFVAGKMDDATIEYRYETANGEWIWLETRGQDRLDDPVIDGLVLVSRDVTERKRRETALDTLHDRTRALFVADSRESIADLTAQTAKEVLGYPITVVRLLSDGGSHLDPVAATAEADEILGERPSYRVGEGTAGEAFLAGEARIYQDLRTVNDGYDRGDARSGLFVPIGDYGVLAIGETEVGALSREDFQMARVLAANVEVAIDRLERERELKRQNERLDEFASVISHDLLGPLNVARGRLNLLEHDPTRIDPIRAALDRMEELIEDVLALARQGRAVDETTDLDLESVVRQSWTSVDTKVARLAVETSRTIQADPARLPQIFENLFRNAVSHGTPDAEEASGDAEITVTVGDLWNGFFVADDGPGIPEELRSQVFEAGFTTGETSTGLGLAIVRDVAMAHGWEVEVTDSETGGARFEFTGVRTAEETE